MNKLAIFDIDGVLADFERSLVEHLAARHGQLGRINRGMFSLEARYRDHPEVLKTAQAFVNDPNVYYCLDYIEGGVGFVKELMTADYPVMYLSSRPKEFESVTRRWLRKNTWNFEQTLGLVCGIQDKASYLKEIANDIAFVVEDNPKHIQALNEANVPVLCWDQQWNEGIFPRIYFSPEWGTMLWEKDDKEAQSFWYLDLEDETEKQNETME